MLRAIYKTGSQLVLNRPADNDLIKIFDTKEEARKALITNTDHSIDWHFSTVDFETNKVFLGCYIRHFMELVEGSEIKGIKEFSIFEHKQEYKKLLKKYISLFKPNNKKWYHIYLAYVFFSKNEMTLTEQEKEQAQSIHDNGISKEIRDVIVEYFN